MTVWFAVCDIPLPVAVALVDPRRQPLLTAAIVIIIFVKMVVDFRSGKRP